MLLVWMNKELKLKTGITLSFDDNVSYLYECIIIRIYCSNLWPDSDQSAFSFCQTFSEETSYSHNIINFLTLLANCCCSFRTF